MKIIFALAGLIAGGALGGIWAAAALGLAGFGLAYWIQNDMAAAKARQPGPPPVAPGADGAAGLHSQLRTLRERVERIEAQLGMAAVLPAAPLPPAAAQAPEPEFELPPMPPAPIPAADPVARAAPAEPAPLPREPSLAASLWERWMGGNLVAKVGVIILFFGVAFLLRYAYERVHVPIEMRLLGAAGLAFVLLAIGWRLRGSHRTYALVLQGGGVGILYLVIFGAFRLFGLLPGPLAFALLVVVAASSAVLAVVQNSLALAALGVSGGFLAPILASTGRGDHVMLFSYYVVLNAGIVGIAWARAWRVLNLLGFGFTLAIGWLWGTRVYQPELFASTEPFLVVLFLMYVGIPILFARRRAVQLKDYVDATLVFGAPVFAFGLQAVMVRPYEYGAAWSALSLAVLYLGLGTLLYRRMGQGLRLLVESFIALSLAFGTLAVPLAFEGRLTSATWALEGAAVVWIGLRQARFLPRVFGYLLQFAAGVAFLVDAGKGYSATPVLNSFYLGCLFLFLGGFFCACYLDRNKDRVTSGEQVLPLILMGWGALWWYGGGLHEIERHVPHDYRAHAMLLFFAASSLGFSKLSGALRWADVGWLRLLLYPAMAVQLLRELGAGLHPFADIGAIAWLAALGVHFRLLARHEDERRPLSEWLHAGGLWAIAILGAREVGWATDQLVEGKRVWASIAWAVVPALLLAAIARPKLAARWPMRGFARSYVVLGGAPIAVFVAAWTVYANVFKDGDPYPLPFVPLLNPLDLAVGVVFVLLAQWLRVLRTQGLEAWWARARGAVYAAFGAGMFIWANGTLLRTLHHWADLPFVLPSMLSSRLVQASFSILWTLLALGAMVVATRRALRPVWLTGAGLMGVVVAKLFLVDLSGIGTVERIVSFIGVGLLMLVVGYFSPVPPARGPEG